MIMLSSVSKRLIRRFGQKGVFVLERNIGVYNEDTLENIVTPTPIPLLAYAEERPVEQGANSTKWSHSFELLIAIDADFNGAISQEDRLVFNSIKYDIEKIMPVVVNGKIAYVEVICNA